MDGRQVEEDEIRRTSRVQHFQGERMYCQASLLAHECERGGESDTWELEGQVSCIVLAVLPPMFWVKR